MNARQAIETTISWYKNLEESTAKELVENDIAAYSKQNIIAV
jgi:hypothetical protein